jgi:hypothetical protein
LEQETDENRTSGMEHGLRLVWKKLDNHPEIADRLPFSDEEHDNTAEV